MAKSAAHWEQLASLWARHARLGTPQSAQECIALGAQLLLLKSVTQQGDFFDRVNELGMGRGVARKYIATARRFGGLPPDFLKAVGTASALVELLSKDDQEIAAQVRARMAEVSGLASSCDISSEKVSLSPDEERLLRCHRQCTKEAREALQRLSGLLARCGA